MIEEIVKHEYGLPVWFLARKISMPPRNKGLVDMHLHNEYEFLEIKSGVMKCLTVDNEVVAKEGDIIFVNSYTPHCTYTMTEHVEDVLLQFKLSGGADRQFRYIARFLNVNDTSLCVFKKGSRETEEIRRCLRTIEREYAEKTAFWNDYVEASVFMIVAILRRYGILSDVMHERSDEIKKIREVISYIDQNYSKDISTAELAVRMNFNESYFCRIFKRAVGTTVIDYINFVRVCKAEKLLDSGMSLSEIAYETGFSSLSYFNRVFKKYNDYTPSEYRKIMKNKEIL